MRNHRCIRRNAATQREQVTPHRGSPARISSPAIDPAASPTGNPVGAAQRVGQVPAGVGGGSARSTEFLAGRPRLSAVQHAAAGARRCRAGPPMSRSSRLVRRPRRRARPARQDDDGAGAVAAPAGRGCLGHHPGQRQPAAGRRRVRRPPDHARQRAGRPERAGLGGSAARRSPRDHAGHWADCVDTVAAMDRVLAAAQATRPIDVLVELGGAGGRTGARSIDEADRMADAVAASEHLRLAGVAGYEGALAHDARRGRDRRGPRLPGAAGRAAPRPAHRRRPMRATRSSSPQAVPPTSTTSPTCSAAVDRWRRRPPAVRVLLRSGAYIIHDDGFYRTISPLSRAGTPLRSAMHAWARVVSRPEPGLALLDAGKRDIPFDEGLPEPQLVADDLGAPDHAARPARTSPRSTTSTRSCGSRRRARCGSARWSGWACPTRAPRSTSGAWIPVVGRTPARTPTRSSSTLIRTHF